jgi:hypothetical protein
MTMERTMEDLEELKEYILDSRRMQMSHIYKPLMVIAVLKRGGEADREQIASDFVRRDIFQLEHYRRNVLDKMPGVRLVRDGVLEADPELIE